MNAPRPGGASGLSRIGVALVALIAALITACSPQDSPTGESSSSFTGPWAEEIAYYDSIAGTDFAHEAFADSTISDAEVQEGMSLILACYDSHGATVEYDAYGYEGVHMTTGTEDPLEVMGICALADGGVVAPHDQIRLNPDNLEKFTIQAACLVDAGIVEPGYTGQDLEHAFDVEQLPFTPGDPTAVACMKDPLGLAAPAGAVS